MGVRKRQMAERIKAEKQQLAFAKLNNCPTSPRKMRLVADLIRGVEVEKGFGNFEVQFKRSFSKVGKIAFVCLGKLAS